MRRGLFIFLEMFADNYGPLVEVVCLALLAALGAWFCYWGLDHTCRRLKAQLGGVDSLTRVVLFALCVFLAPFASSKFTNGVSRMGAPSSSPGLRVASSSASPSPSPALAITDFALTPSSAVLEVNWPFGTLTADSCVWIHARTNLVVGAWEPVWCAAPGDISSRTVEIPFADMPFMADGMQPKAAFFAAEAQILADVDHDGVPDREETGWIGFGAELPAFDFASAVESVTHFDSAEDGWRGWWEERPVIPLPFAVWCGGVFSTNAVALANGVVGFLTAGREGSILDDSPYNQDFSDEYFVYSDDHAAIAACWTNLDIPRDLDTSIRYGTFGAIPRRWFVIEYAGVTLFDRVWDDDPPRATFQVAVSEADPTTVHVRYHALSNGFDFASATLGAQGPEGLPTLPVAYNVATAATNGMVVSYHFGHGSDPQLRDTDGDGLDDGREVDHGLSPRLADTDGDGLPDKWELDHGFDPLSVLGDDGRDGDPDLDGLPNISEYAHGTNPRERDIDRDGLLDGEEVGGITVTNVLPWLTFDAGTAVDLTYAFPDSSWSLANWRLPVPLVVQGMSVTNAVLDVNGTVYFVRAGGEGPEWSQGPYDLSGDYVAQPDALLVAPYWGNLSLEPELPTRIRTGTATHEGVGYLLIEYESACQDLWWDETNAVSFQVAVPTNGADRAYVRYRDVTGSETDGRYAAVGFQTFDGRTRASHCFWETGRVRGGLALQFLFGTGSDPLAGDTDADGLDDAAEARSGTDPRRIDTDSDGMPDKWETDHGLAPRNPSDAALDPDGDCLSNLEEYLNQTDPGVLAGPAAGFDSDGDGVDDGAEVRQGSDPNDPSDHGVAPPDGSFRELVFNIDGDYAAWEMTIQGLGPYDLRTQLISMGAPGARQKVPKKLRKGNSYRLSMRWLNCDGHNDRRAPWYCWQATIDDQPSSQSFSSYSNKRLDGNEIVVGTGWVADNVSGLLTSHVDECTKRTDGSFGGGNVAGSLTATLYVLDVNVEICDPHATNWCGLAASRVVLDDEELHIKVAVTPPVGDLSVARRALGDSLTLRTSGTRPGGVSVPLNGAAFVNVGGRSEIRVTKTFSQLRELGLLPSRNDDGVDEMSVYDVGTLGGNDGSDLSDCLAFEQMALARRGRASNEGTLTLDSNPPNSELSESFFRAAGAEVLSASYGGVQSAKRQIMNQADYFYYSGHGHHKTGMVDNFSPDVISDHWKRDLDCVIFAGCSVLDINDYNNNFLNPEGEWDPENHAASPGKLWEAKGPNVLLGYNHYAPLDASQAPARIVQSWQNLRQTMGDVEAWMKANDNKNGRNACAIVKGVKYVYFKRVRHRFFSQRFSTYKKVEVGKESWND